jgi:hypothetical protein
VTWDRVFAKKALDLCKIGEVLGRKSRLWFHAPRRDRARVD